MGSVGGRQVAIGSARFMEAAGIPRSLLERAEALRAQGKSVIFAAVDGKAVAVLAVADPIKETTPEAVEALKALGVRLVMLSGDAQQTAAAVGARLGIDEVVGGVLPEQKAERVKALQAQGRVVAMAGDGINDAPALAQADIGIAMGTGSDVAMESAAVTLVKGDLRGIAKAMRLSRATMRNVKQNLFFAFLYNGRAGGGRRPVPRRRGCCAGRAWRGRGGGGAGGAGGPSRARAARARPGTGGGEGRRSRGGGRGARGGGEERGLLGRACPACRRWTCRSRRRARK